MIWFENGSEFRSEFGHICDKHTIKPDDIPSGVRELNGVVERPLTIFDVAQKEAREPAHVLFSDAEIAKGVNSLWAESMASSVGEFNRTCTSANTDFKSPHECILGSRHHSSFYHSWLQEFARGSAVKNINPRLSPDGGSSGEN